MDFRSLKFAQEDYEDLHGKMLCLMDDVRLHKVVTVLYAEYCNEAINMEDWIDKVLQQRMTARVDQMEERNGEPS